MKEILVTNLELDLAKFSLYEEKEKKQRFIRPWVQSSPLTDRLGRNSRLLNTVFNSVEKSLETQARASTGPQMEVINEVKYLLILYLDILMTAKTSVFAGQKKKQTGHRHYIRGKGLSKGFTSNKFIFLCQGLVQSEIPVRAWRRHLVHK